MRVESKFDQHLRVVAEVDLRVGGASGTLQTRSRYDLQLPARVVEPVEDGPTSTRPGPAVVFLDRVAAGTDKSSALSTAMFQFLVRSRL